MHLLAIKADQSNRDVAIVMHQKVTSLQSILSQETGYVWGPLINQKKSQKKGQKKSKRMLGAVGIEPTTFPGLDVSTTLAEEGCPARTYTEYADVDAKRKSYP